MSSKTKATTFILMVGAGASDGAAIGATLARCGHALRVVADAGEGIEQASRQAPEAILVDADAAGPEGPARCRSLKSHPATRDIPLIVIVTDPGAQGRLAYFEAGATDLVIRPFLAEELAARVDAQARLRAAERELDRRQAEFQQRLAERTAELQQSAEQLRLKSFALNHVREGAFLIDSVGRFRYVNAQACLSLGFSTDELLAMGIADIDPDWTAERGGEGWLELMENGVQLIESRHRRKDGSTFPVEIVASYLNYRGEGYNLALVRDISERREAEEASLAREREFRLLAENLPDCVARYSPDGRVAYYNPQLEKLLGVTAEAVKGEVKPLSFSDGLYSDYTQRVIRVGRTGVADELDLPIPTAQAGLRFHHIRIVPERDEDGEIVGVLAIGRDVTERKRAEDRLKESYDLLQDLATRRDSVREEERGRIAREVHDELGQQLTALRMGISTFGLVFGGDQPAVQQHMEYLHGLADTTIQCVRDIAVALRPAVLDSGVDAALEWLVADFRRLTGAECRLRVPETMPDFDRYQAVAVFRIVQESLTNIARHAGAKKVTVAMEFGDGTCCVTIQDDGCGFDPGRLRDGSLGLRGMRERALMLRGELFIDSHPGAGTIIKLKMPFQEGEKTP
ncbi:MAG TPA: PAS domain S-box protein [Rhodocyclaceae bacterium]|nr:PAS domain S-box protein [Rhodocyclaceae bacterium]